MRSWLAHAAWLTCALLCSHAVAQTPDDAGDAARKSLAALAKAPATDAVAAAVQKQRTADATSLVQLIAGGAVPVEVRRKIDVGVAAVLLGSDPTARDALLRAVTGRRTVTLRWWGPLATLWRDPERPTEVIAPVVQCLADAAWPKLVTELVGAFEDAAAEPPARVRAIEAAGVLAQFALPGWGPVGPLVKALSDGVEPVHNAAERELERLLFRDASTTAVELRRWWDAVKDRSPSATWRLGLHDALTANAAQRAKTRADFLALLPHLDVPGLVKALSYGFVDVRAEAAKQLQTRPDPTRAALAPLTQRLTVEPDAVVREAIITAIGARVQAGDTAVLQQLATRTAEGTERYPRVRRAAVFALARTPVTSSVSAVLGALMTDTAPTVREAAAEALTGFGGLVQAATVAKALVPATEQSAVVRVAVARTLGKLGGGARGDTDACVPLARAAETDPDPNVRWQAVFALGTVVCEGSEAVDAMIHALTQDDVPRVRKLAVGQLGKHKNPAAFDRIAAELVKVLGESDAEMADAATAGLRRLGANDAGRLLDFALKAEKAKQLRGEAVLFEAALGVVANGFNEKPLTELQQNDTREKLVDLWERVGDPGSAIPHARWLYLRLPTTGRARKIADLSVRAGKFKDGMIALREATVRFAGHAEELKDHGIEQLYEHAVNGGETVEIAAAEALVELGELPAESQWMADAIVGGAKVARALAQAAGGDDAARVALHEAMAQATGFALVGRVHAALLRLKAAWPLDAQADAALRSVGAARFPAPNTARAVKTWTAEQRSAHHAAWSNAWRQVKGKLSAETPKKNQPPKKEKKPK